MAAGSDRFGGGEGGRRAEFAAGGATCFSPNKAATDLAGLPLRKRASFAAVDGSCPIEVGR
jgi:hypothetical protein